MPEPLWDWPDVVAAAQGVADGAPGWPVRGLSIDTRTLHPGDVFVALLDKRDGHEFVPAAFRAVRASSVSSATTSVRGAALSRRKRAGTRRASIARSITSRLRATETTMSTIDRPYLR